MVAGKACGFGYGNAKCLMVYFFFVFRDYCGNNFDLVLCPVDSVSEGGASVGEDFLFDGFNFRSNSVKCFR